MDYELILTGRRTISAEIKPDGKVIVRANYKTPKAAIEKFLSDKSRWIEKHLERIKSKPRRVKFSEEEIKGFILAAKAQIPEKTARFAETIGVDYGKITVRRARTLWGSCTLKGNLNFNCLLSCVPNRVCDYVIIHELCHRKQMNHSQAFWRMVEKYCPDYKSCRKWLKDFGADLLLRI